MSLFSGKDLKTLRAPSHHFHLRYLLGIPDEFEGHEGDVLIVSNDNPYHMVFANITPSGLVVTEKIRIDGLEPAGYLGELVDNDTIVVIGDVNNKRIAVSDQLLKRAGGNITGNITMEPGTTIDGVDISELYSYFLDKNTIVPQSIAGPVVFSGYATFAGGTNISGTGGTGVSSFSLLTDTPSNYTGQAGKFLKVNTAGDALVFTDAPTGTGGSSVMTGLTDTPSDYIGSGKYAIRVKDTEDGVEFIDVDLMELSSSTSDLINDVSNLTTVVSDLSSSTSDDVSDLTQNIGELSSSTNEVINNVIALTTVIGDLTSSTTDIINDVSDLNVIVGELSSSTDDIELDIDNIYEIVDELSSSTTELEIKIELIGVRTTETFNLTPSDISSKYVQLQYKPIDPESVIIKIKGSSNGIYGVDFTINDRLIRWDSYIWDTVLSIGDDIYVTYWYKQ